jgi:hypothetical protein
MIFDFRFLIGDWRTSYLLLVVSRQLKTKKLLTENQIKNRKSKIPLSRHPKLETS